MEGSITLATNQILTMLALMIFGISFMTALLVGVVVSSTDPAVLIPLFKNMNISYKLKQTIISESAFNDAVAAITTFTIIGIIVNNEFSINNTFIKLGQSAGVGILVGCILGLFSSMLISEKPYGFLMEYQSKVALGTVCASYTAATILGGSWFMAVFIAGIIFGNKELIGLSHSEVHEVTHFHFKEVLSDIFRMMIFISLGT